MPHPPGSATIASLSLEALYSVTAPGRSYFVLAPLPTLSHEQQARYMTCGHLENWLREWEKTEKTERKKGVKELERGSEGELKEGRRGEEKESGRGKTVVEASFARKVSKEGRRRTERKGREEKRREE